jgi:hypothetical protein
MAGKNLFAPQKTQPSQPGRNLFAPGAPEVGMPWGDVFSQAFENAPEDGKLMVKEFATMVMEPRQTAKSLWQLASGMVQLLIPGKQDNEKVAQAVGKMFMDHYTTVEGFKKHFAKRPLSVISDAAGLISGGATLLAKLPGKAGKAAAFVRKSADVADPMMLPINAVSKVMNPRTGAKVKTLMKEGVNPTIGQILGASRGAGRIVDVAEQALSSVPVLGAAPKAGRRRAALQLNTAAANRALAPIGKNADGITPGADLVAHVHDTLSAEFNRILPSIVMKPDMQLIDNIITAIKKHGSEMTEMSRTHLDHVVKEIVSNRLLEAKQAGAKVIPGKLVQIMKSDLDRISADLMAGTTQAERSVGRALEDVSSAVMKNLERSNPSKVKELKAVQEGWANYVRIREGSTRPNAPELGMSPVQLDAGVKAADRSMRKARYGEGRSLMQDLSSAGKEVLKSDLPSSGTTDRALWASLLGGSSAGVIPFIDPLVGLGATVGTATYAPYIQGGVARLLTRRPGAVRKVGSGLGKYGPTVARAARLPGRLKQSLEEEYR